MYILIDEFQDLIKKDTLTQDDYDNWNVGLIVTMIRIQNDIAEIYGLDNAWHLIETQD